MLSNLLWVVLSFKNEKLIARTTSANMTVATIFGIVLNNIKKVNTSILIQKNVKNVFKSQILYIYKMCSQKQEPLYNFVHKAYYLIRFSKYEIKLLNCSFFCYANF